MFYHHQGLLPFYFNHLVCILRSSGDPEFPACSNPLFQKLSGAVMVLVSCNLSTQEVEGSIRRSGCPCYTASLRLYWTARDPASKVETSKQINE